MQHLAEPGLPHGVSIVTVRATDRDAVLDAHALLRRSLDDGNVEDVDSFLATLAPAADGSFVPRMLCAVRDEKVSGVVLGAYLTRVKTGMVLYSAVDAPLRSQGVYKHLRGGLMEWLAAVAPPSGPDYVISELEADSQLGRKYIRDWGAFVAHCDYEVPATQGLAPRRLDLLVQPVARRSPPTGPELESIIREVYERVYRLEDVERSAIFRRVVQSVRAGVREGGPDRTEARSCAAR